MSFISSLFNKALGISLIVVVPICFAAAIWHAHADPSPSRQDYGWLDAVKGNQKALAQDHPAYDRVVEAASNGWTVTNDDLTAYNAFVKAKADNEYKVQALQKDGWTIQWNADPSKLQLVPFRKPQVTGAKVDLSQFTEDTRLTDDQLRNVLRNAGFAGRSLQVAFAVARAESGGRPYAFNGRGADKSYGILQINMKGSLGRARLERYGLASVDDLYQPEVNAAIAYRISNGGTSWHSWGAYTNGSYRKYL